MNARIKMKALEAQSGIGRETIRYYIKEGILPEPDKPKANVAFYSQVHLKRLLAIKYMQQEREMSLARIKSILSSGEFDKLSTPSSLKGLEQLLPALLDGATATEDLSIKQVIEKTGLSRRIIEDLVGRGVIHSLDGDSLDGDSLDCRVSYRDVIILEKWAQAKDAGFTEANGYDNGLLDLYKKTIDQLAAYEMALFFSGFGENTGPKDAATKLAIGLDCANTVLQQMHNKAVISAIEKKLSEPLSEAPGI